MLPKNKKRLFVFGCSFTNYSWATWANILAHSYQPEEFYNLGRGGAGNLYIFNKLAETDSLYNFTRDDIVIVLWSSFFREDRYLNDSWITPGNVYKNGEYSKELKKYFGDVGHCMERDLPIIKTSFELFRRKTNFYHALMQSYPTFNENSREYSDVIFIKNYDRFFSKMKNTFLGKSFIDSVYGSIHEKANLDREKYTKYWGDHHPTISEHLIFLQKVLRYKVSKNTIDVVKREQANLDKIILHQAKKEKPFNLPDLEPLPESLKITSAKLDIHA